MASTCDFTLALVPTSPDIHRAQRHFMPRTMPRRRHSWRRFSWGECPPRRLLGTTGASTRLARQIGIAFGPAIGTTFWVLPGYNITGMRMAMGVATILAAFSFVALLRTPRQLP
jgi:hypothetical protein